MERPGSPSSLRPWFCRQLGGRQLGRQPGRDFAWTPEPGSVCLHLKAEPAALTTLPPSPPVFYLALGRKSLGEFRLSRSILRRKNIQSQNRVATVARSREGHVGAVAS